MRPSALRVAAAHQDKQAKKWKNLPKGWTDESVRKFWDKLTVAAPEHKVTECIDKMTGKFSNPGAFCGGLADWMIPGWRQEVAKKKREEKAKDKKAGGCNCGCGKCGPSPDNFLSLERFAGMLSG